MKLYAHRGWSKGPGENSLEIFKRAIACTFLNGVEFDVRRGRDGRPVVIHDPMLPEDNPPLLEEVVECLAPSNLELFAEIKEPDIGAETIEVLCQKNVADRSVVFGFPNSASELPWSGTRRLRLGLIAHIPWQAESLTDKFRPDVLMAGWDQRLWTRIAYEWTWPLFSLRRIGDKYNIPIAGGIARTTNDHVWLERRGFDIAVADLDASGIASFADGGDVPVSDRN